MSQLYRISDTKKSQQMRTLNHPTAQTEKTTHQNIASERRSKRDENKYEVFKLKMQKNFIHKFKHIINEIIRKV